jgi:simple sugar transport system permease protein
MMLVGALAAFAAVAGGAGLGVALAAAVLTGALAAGAFAVLTLTLQANQVAAGLALTILGTGISAFLGRSYVGFRAPDSFEDVRFPGLADLPVLGPFFSLNVLGYAAIVMLLASAWFLFRTKPGLALRAVGESPEVARALGLRVTRIRYAAVLFGGAMAGVAGCYYAVAQFKMWQEGLTTGNGWIALALVVFAAWRPWRMALGALLFGAVSGFSLYLQATGVHVSPFVLGSLPYLATIAALVAVSASPQLLRRHAPAALGKPFFDGD